MKSNILPMAIAALCLPRFAPLIAQMPDDAAAPRVLMVVREQMKRRPRGGTRAQRGGLAADFC